MFNETWSNWRTQIHPLYGILIFAASGCEVSRCLASTLPPAIPHLLPSQSSADVYINVTHWESELSAFAFDSSSLEDNCKSPVQWAEEFAVCEHGRSFPNISLFTNVKIICQGLKKKSGLWKDYQAAQGDLGCPAHVIYGQGSPGETRGNRPNP